MKTRLQILTENTSKDWLPQERGDLMCELNNRILDMKERVTFLRTADPRFLEANRKAILGGKIRMEDGSILDGGEP